MNTFVFNPRSLSRLSLRTCLLAALLGGCGRLSGAVDPIADSIAGYLHYPYRLYVPAEASPSNLMPLWISLHGAGESGTDNIAQVTKHVQTLLDETQEGAHRAILLAPQSPNWWVAPSNLDDLIEKVASEYPVDRSRIYISGISRGGFGTYGAITDTKELYAAALTLSGWEADTFTADLGMTPFWLIHGEDDLVVDFSHSQRMYDAMVAAGNNPRLTAVPGWGHTDWIDVYGDDPTYTSFYEGGDPANTLTGIYPWMFSHQRSTVASLRNGGSGDRFLIDLGWFHSSVGVTGPGVDDLGREWNNIWDADATTPGLIYYGLTTTRGKRTTAQLELLDAFEGVQTDGSPSSALYNRDAQADGWWTGVAGDHAAALLATAELRVSGLPVGVPCRIVAFGSEKNENPDRVAQISCNGQSARFDAAHNLMSIAILENLYPAADGSLNLTFGVAPEGISTLAYLNVLEIEVDPQLQVAVELDGTADLRVQAWGHKGWSYHLEISDDLETWNDSGLSALVGINTDTAISWTMTNPLHPFVRVVETPPIYEAPVAAASRAALSVPAISVTEPIAVDTIKTRLLKRVVRPERRP